VRRVAAAVLPVGLLFVAPPSAGTQDLGPAIPPHLIVRDAVVLTMDPEMPLATAFAITDDRFVAVGNDTEILVLAGPTTTVVDLDGKAVTPGFIDSHSHWIGDRGLYGVETAQEAIRMALEGGWTSINEHFVNQSRLDELTELDATGELRLRVNAYLPVNYGPDQRFGMWFSDHEPGEVVGPRLRLAGVKFFIDGCSANTMYMTEGRKDDPTNFGNFHWRRNELRRMVRRVHDAGWQIAAHSCGDAATDEILDALKLAFGEEDGRPFRARLEHVIALRDDQIRRMRRMGVLPSLQVTFADSDWRKGFQRRFDADQHELLGRWRDLAEDARLHAIGSTDTPFGEEYPDLQPTTVMDALAQAMTRIAEPGQHPAGYMLEQRLTLMQALHLLTVAGAFGIFAEDDLGIIAPGKLADFVVLSSDPREVRPRALESIDVAMVFVGGQLEVCAPGYEADCPSSP
jgi:predicted amidohydrolase YtcJ